MLVLLFIMNMWSDYCHSQLVYMPRYMVRPVRRSAMEALERLRLPVARYFPQVDTQAVPYQGGPPFVAAGYPNQWAEDYGSPQVIPPPAEEEESDYGNYEYPAADLGPSSLYRPPPPQFGEEVYAQEPVDTYGNLMDRYMMEDRPAVREEMFEVQRRQTAEKENATAAPAPLSTQKSVVVQMTAVPPAPEKKGIKSLVVPDEQRAEKDRTSGQKEEPLFRPLQSSQRTLWNSDNKAATPQQKTPIPLLKKIIQQGGQQKKRNQQDYDPLLDELNNLKRKKPVF